MDSYLIDLCELSNSIEYTSFFSNASKDIYHYTSPLAFQSIIENQKLRFSDRYYLNDGSEGKAIMQLCLDELDEVAPDDPKFKECLKEECNKRYKKPQRDNFYVFQCSFSVDQDSLCLWNYYTKGDCLRGYNLHFKSGELRRKIEMQPDKCCDKGTSGRPKGRTPQIISAKVVYKKREQKKIVKQVIQQFYNFSVAHSRCDEKFTIEILVDKLMILGVFFKKECFEPEHEYRFAISLYLNNDGTYAAIKEKQEFLEKDGLFVPYVDLKFAPEALKSVYVSPTLDLERARESILRLSQGKFPQFSDVSLIKQSGIPLRY